ncbi:hypothetical protein EYR38_003423 [Pleurotus pulmonarius]|nr:hypothetical protein EYR38_003423 [Pleurotus pulmonarius]
MGAITATESLIVSLFFVSFLEGVFVMLMATGVYLAQAQNQRKDRKWTGLGVCSITFFLSTVHFIMIFYQYYGLLGGSGRYSPSNLQGYARFNLASYPVAYLNAMLACLILTWKAWTLYDKSWAVVAGGVTGTVALGVASYGFVAVSYQEIPNLVGSAIDDFYSVARVEPIRAWALSSIVLTVVTSLALTGLIMVKLVAQQRAMKEYSSAVFDLLLFFESGALFASGWIIYLVLFLVDNQATILAFDSMSQLSGIVPSLIIILTSAGATIVTPRVYTDRRPTVPSSRVETSMQFGGPMDTGFSVSMGGDSTELETKIGSKKSKERLYVN